MNFIAKTIFGLEHVLSQELRDIGAQDIKVLNRAVQFSGDLQILYRANYELRTAIRILLPKFHFEAKSEQQLYDGVYDINWSKIFGVDDTFAIDAALSSNYFKHSKYAALKTKDAIVDQYRKIYNRRPSIDIKNPHTRLNLHIYDNNVSISIDSSGESLHKRGYRSQGHEAPLNEILAAGMIKLSQWNGKHPFVDFMCGSGTLVTEAAMLAAKIPNSVNRDHFNFMNWPDFDEALWQDVVDEALDKMIEPETFIWANDVSRQSTDQTEVALRHFNLHKKVKITTEDFEQICPTQTCGTVMINPPYGERLHDQNIINLYGDIGTHFKHHFEGWTAWLISSNFKALKNVGLRPSSKHVLFNGSLECKFQEYQLYRGSKKASKNKNSTQG